jgi:hypothetical protein
LNVTSSQKRKGSRAELDVVKYLRTRQIKADRIQAGTHADKGDVTGWPGIVIEVKDRQQHNWADYFRQLAAQIANANAYTGVIICKRPGQTNVAEWLAVMPVHEWINLLFMLEEKNG